MLDLNRYYPPKYYIADVYLKYLAEKKKKTGLPKDYSSFEWMKAFQFKASDISTGKRLKEAHMSCCTFYVMIYNTYIEKLSLSGENWFSG